MKILISFILLFCGTFNFAQNISELKFQLSSLNSSNEINHAVNALTPAPTAQKKSPGLAILYSSLLPGMGELYAGTYSLGQYFTIAEAVFWVTYLGIDSYGNWQKDNYRAFAKTVGKVNLNEKNDEYFANIGDYTDIHQYNEEMSFQRKFDEMYNLETHFWKWESTPDRKSYRSMWVSSQQSYNNLRFVVGGMILNRIASIINAVRLVTAHNKGLDEISNWNINFDYSNSPEASSNLSLNFILQF